MKTTTLFIILTFSQFIFADTLFVHSTSVKVNKISQSSTFVIGAIIDEPLTLTFGENKLENIPAGSYLYFQSNNGKHEDLEILRMIISKPMNNQSWTLANGTTLNLNCGKVGTSTAFLEFSSDRQLLKGCFSVGEQKIYRGESVITTLDRSSLEFFEDGSLKASSLSRGEIFINKQTIRLAEESSIRYHENHELYYFNPMPGEVFHFATELGEETLFTQPKNVDPFAVMFHPNGQLSTAWLAKSDNDPYLINVSMFGTMIEMAIKTAPIGFNEQGITDRLQAANRITVKASEKTYVRSTETSMGIASSGSAPEGAEITIQADQHLFFNSDSDQRVLRGFTSHGSGLSFFNELSPTPFN